ncbi:MULTISPECIES: efflux RND transporter periplasmic adaptor subunit [Inquilinus]|uniref:HlyD family secretion protein n=1 Tax=Inquilinus ginsengisoli TaxID=363840 RepID=A0ABU1JPA9_9PROT|nr:efflux RND transporter periplasmic adaptor subunit [Inquilinus ginsengisoli]MDR6290455.1 HlyD family secretion protein [Inquilinus ginsengisoli]
MSRSRSRWFGLLLLAGVACLSVVAGGWRILASDRAVGDAGPATPPPATTIARAEMHEVVETLAVTGTLAAREEVLVGAEVDGLRIVTIEADVGDRVAAGQVLARLDHAQLDAQLAQAEATIAKAEAAIQQARASIDEAEASAAQSQASLERAQTLRASGNTSAEQLLARQTEVKVATARITSAEETARSAAADKNLAEAQRDEIALRIARAEIKAPVAGVVSERQARIGAVVGVTSPPLFRMIRDGEVEFLAEVTETGMPRVMPGQAAELQLTGLDAPIRGTVRLVDPTVDATSRLGRVAITLPAEPGLRPGVFAQGMIEIGRRRTLTVPLSAVFFSADGAYVQAVDQAVVNRRPVEIGFVGDGRVEIRRGLAEGDTVVLRAGSFLRPGDRIAPVQGAVAAAAKAG